MVKRKKKRRHQKSIISLIVAVAIAIAGAYVQMNPSRSSTTSEQTTDSKKSAQVSAADLSKLDYSNQQIIKVNNNKPTFTHEDLSIAHGSWQAYSNLDSLNRVGPANAMLGRDLMPKVQRDPLYVNPTGWHNKRITYHGESVWIYNRSHLIGYQLTGQNNNVKNLMTGTQSLNSPGMEDYENEIARYIKKTDHHVRYQVQPVFRDNELLARGVHMMAQSVEDDQISFNIYIFNVQNGVQLNYADGTSQATN